MKFLSKMRKKSRRGSEKFIEIEFEADKIDKYIPKSLDGRVVGKLKELNNNNFKIYTELLEEAREKIDYHIKNNYFWFKKHNFDPFKEGINLLRVAYAITVKGGYIKR